MKPWWLRNVKLEEAGGTGDAGGGGTIKMEDMVKHINTLTGVVAGLASGMKEMQSSISNIPESFKELLPRQPEPKEPSGESGFADMDLEQLDRRQFGTLLVGEVLKKIDGMLDAKVKTFDEKLNAVQGTVARDLGSRQLKEVQDKHADVMEWKDEIRDILANNPGLSLGQAYVLARNDNPAKTEQIDTKYKKPEGEGGKGDVFFGLTPTSTGAAPSEKGPRRLPFNQAAEKALDDVMAQLGGGSIDSVAKLTR